MPRQSLQLFARNVVFLGVIRHFRRRTGELPVCIECKALPSLALFVDVMEIKRIVLRIAVFFPGHEFVKAVGNPEFQILIPLVSLGNPVRNTRGAAEFVLGRTLDRVGRRHAGQHLVECRSGGVYVGPRSLFALAAVLFLGGITRLEYNRKCSAESARHISRRTEIDQLDVSVLAEEDIVRRNVAVNQTEGMYPFQCVQNRNDNGKRLLL